MKILMTADALGGVWSYARQLCLGLSSRNVQVELATMGRALSDSQRADIEGIPGVRLHESDYQLCWMSDPWNDVNAAGAWLLDLARRTSPDVVHLNDLGHAALDWPAPVLLTAHSCVFSWWRAVHQTPAPREEWWRYHQLVEEGLNRADLIAAPTWAMLQVLREHYAFHSPAMVISNGSDFPDRVPEASLDTAQREPIILSSGRAWDPAKNMSQLARVVRRLPWPIYVAGETQSPDGKTSELEGVHCLGQLPPANLQAWLRRASIFVSVAHYEPFGLGVLEAARSGTALVLSDIPSFKELWGDAALFVPPRDEAALEEALRRLVNDPQLRHTLSREAWRRALLFTSNKMIEQTWGAYGRLLAGDRARPTWDASIATAGAPRLGEHHEI